MNKLNKDDYLVFLVDNIERGWPFFNNIPLKDADVALFRARNEGLVKDLTITPKGIDFLSQKTHRGNRK